MKVNLIKEAYYEINDKKSLKVPFDAFLKMCGTTLEGSQKTEEEIALPNLRLFSTIEDFRALSKQEMDKLDNAKDVIMLPTGNFCVFLKDDDNTEVSATTVNQSQNVATSTKEDTEDNATDLK